ncbi:MAG: DinB family protein [Thermoanaerobaculia bacterium]
MVERRRWFERRFEAGLPAGALPDLLERLRGTPARLEERLRLIPANFLTRRLEGRWSIQENVGHLLDLEPLWERRLDDFLAGAGELSPADLTNRKTHEAGHNEKNLSDLLGAFRSSRLRLVERLASTPEAVLGRTALHPRLGTPMTLADLAFFVAEHDDHHLASMTEIVARLVAG